MDSIIGVLGWKDWDSLSLSSNIGEGAKKIQHAATYVKGAATRVIVIFAKSAGDIEAFHKMFKFTNYTLQGVEYLGCRLPVGVMRAIPVVLDLYDATRIFPFVRDVKGYMDNRGREHGLKADVWNNGDYASTFGIVILSAADVMSGVMLFFGSPLESYARWCVIAGMLLLNADSYKGYCRTSHLLERDKYKNPNPREPSEVRKAKECNEYYAMHKRTLIKNFAECIVQGTFLAGYAGTTFGAPAIVICGMISAGVAAKLRLDHLKI